MPNIFESFVELSKRELNEGDKDAIQIIYYYLVTLTISKTNDECVLNKPFINDFILRLQTLAQKDTAAKVIASACLLWITSPTKRFQFYRVEVRNISAAERQDYFSTIKQQAEKGDPEAQTIMGIIHCFRLMVQTDQPRGRSGHLGFAELPSEIKAEVLGWLEKAVAQDYFYAHTIMLIYRYNERNCAGITLPADLRVFSKRAMELGEPYIYYVLGDLAFYSWDWKKNGSTENQFEAPGIAWTAIGHFEQMLGVDESVKESEIASPKVHVIEHPNAQFKCAKMALHKNVYRYMGKRTYEQSVEDAFFWFSKAWKNGVREARDEIERFILIKQASSIQPKLLPVIYDQYPPLNTFAKITFCLYRERQLYSQLNWGGVHRSSRLAALPYDIIMKILSGLPAPTLDKQDNDRFLKMFFTVKDSNTKVTARTVSATAKLIDFEPKIIQLGTPDKGRPKQVVTPDKNPPQQVCNYPVLFKFRYCPPAAAEQNPDKQQAGVAPLSSPTLSRP